MYRATPRWTAACAVLLGALGWAATPAFPAHAATNTVSVCDESHLRSAINAAAQSDTVTFGCSGTITLSSTIALTRNLTIDGSGRTVTISGGGNVQVFRIASSEHITLNHLTVTGGAANTGSSTNSNGGGVDNEGGTLTVSNSTFSGNKASFGHGGGIYNNGGTVLVTNSTFSGNHAAFGGGGINNDEATGILTVINSTFSGNVADGYLVSDGGLIAGLGGGIENDSGTLTVTNATFSGNDAYDGYTIESGRLNGRLTLTNTILDQQNTVYGDCDFPVSITDNGGNLASDNSCGFTRSAVVHDAGQWYLDPNGLQSNGGPTQTIKLLPGSPAINAATCLQSTDQRGYLRPGTGKTTCDSGAYESGATASPTAPSMTVAKWYSDGSVDASFLQQAGVTPGSNLASCSGLRSVSGDFNGDGLADMLVYCPSTGAFQKFHGTSGTGSQFTTEPVQYVGNASGAWTNVTMLAASFNSDGKTDILVYRSDTGAYQKWFSDGGIDAGFTYEPTQYVGNAPGAWTNVQMLAADFNGDGKSDILVYRSDTGAYAKWFSDGLVDAGFTFEPTQYVGNAPGAWTNIQMVAANFNGDHRTDILVYRTDTGAYAKWFSDGSIDAGFTFESSHYVGNAPGAWTNIQMLAADFDGDGKTDILVYRIDTGAYVKWYSDGLVDTGFIYESTQYVGNAPGTWTNVKMLAADFNGDGAADILVYRTDTGAYAKWFSLPHTLAAGFSTYEPTQYAGGTSGAWSNLQMLAADFNGDGRTDLLISHS